MTALTLETPHLVLQLADLQATLTMISELPEAVRQEVSPIWHERLLAATEPSPWICGFEVRRRVDRLTVGGAAFKGPPDPMGCVEIAYGIEPEFQGRGYATEVAVALAAFALGLQEVRTVLAHTKADNPASRRVLEKAGFVHVGLVMDPEDGEVDRFEYRCVPTSPHLA
ncbi:MAG: GNAT family N-acetyltransferase [Armatimonadota bacterium]